jgi:hypothetical protein
MSAKTQDIPVAILIFEKDGCYSYRAYSPKNETTELDTTISNQDFMNNIYKDINYNIDTPLNNITKHGLLLEVHTRYSSVPLHERSDTVYFGVYSHLHCKYKPVHTATPILFNVTNSGIYDNFTVDDNGVTMISTLHEFI